jgi:hypothetical protein
MAIETPTTRQDQNLSATDESAPALRPWTTPRLQRLHGSDAAKPWTPVLETSSSGPFGGPS